MDSDPSSGLNFESGGGGETNRAEKAKSVFFKTVFWIPDSAQDFGVKIGAPPYVVDNFFRERILKESVDGKVAALRVFFRRRKFDRIRTSSIFVRAVSPKGRDFDCFT